MYFDLIRRNSRCSRKENQLYYASLLISVAAFYMILSLDSQDVMRFLRKIESDAVQKLLLLIPLLYGVTLVILFFLVYYVTKYQMEQRSHEFGVYLMLGMRRGKLFLMLLSEETVGSLLTLAVGILAAVFLAEAVSLVTVRLVGIGILGHQVTLSAKAILWTVIGFLVVRMAAFLSLSGKMMQKEIGYLLNPTPEQAKPQRRTWWYVVSLLAGIILLAAAYMLAISGTSWLNLRYMTLTLTIGMAGMFLLFYGLRVVFSGLAKKRGKRDVISTFTFRQLQENTILQSGTLAVCSLLILAAACLFGFGAAAVWTQGSASGHVLDYTFPDWENDSNIESQLQKHEIRKDFADVFEVKICQAYDLISLRGLREQIENLEETTGEESAYSYDLSIAEESCYMIALSGYNHLLEIAGKEPVTLQERQAAVYRDEAWAADETMKSALEQNPQVELGGEMYTLAEKIYDENFVTDSAITLSFALIVPDELFEVYAKENTETYWNAVLSPEIVEEAGLMQAIMQENDKLDRAGLSYESYLQNMGRQLFYAVAEGYISIYLAVIFLVTGNTMLGVQFLMRQRKNGCRYRTLLRLGCGYEMLCRSVERQIRWFFGIPAAVAMFSSGFGILSLFSGLLPSGVSGEYQKMLLIAAGILLLVCAAEFGYIRMVKKMAKRQILALQEPEREE